MMVFHEEVEMVKNRQHGCRHGPKGSHRNFPSFPYFNRPRHVSISYDGRHWGFEPIKELLEWSFHLRQHRRHEAREVLGSNMFGWDYVGDRSEPDVGRLVVRTYEAEPLLGNNKSYENIGAFGTEQLAEVHHRIDVASTRIRHRHHVAFAGVLCFGWFHCLEVFRWLFDQLAEELELGKEIETDGKLKLGRARCLQLILSDTKNQ